jgi:cystathionine beta-lyase/cystathionine gamma-synthase
MSTEYLVLSQKGSRYEYNRSRSNSSEKLDKILTQRYNTQVCILTPSGMSAIFSTLQALMLDFGKQTNIIYGSELYCDTPKVIRYLSNYTIKIDVTKPKEIVKLFQTKLKNKINILFIESCSNPDGYIFDFSILPKLRKNSFKFCCVVDNTWLTDVIFNPFNYGADIVVASLTKYYSGGNAIAGAILGSLKNTENIYQYTIRAGLHVSPYNINIILEKIQTMEKRIKHSSHVTLKVIKKLNKMDGLEIHHPSMEEHPSHNLAVKYFKNNLYPSVFTFYANRDKKEVLKVMKNSQIDHKTSFGAPHLRTDPYPKSHGNKTLCRIAIGYQDKKKEDVKKLKTLIKLLV